MSECGCHYDDRGRLVWCREAAGLYSSWKKVDEFLQHVQLAVRRLDAAQAKSEQSGLREWVPTPQERQEARAANSRSYQVGYAAGRNAGREMDAAQAKEPESWTLDEQLRYDAEQDAQATVPSNEPSDAEIEAGFRDDWEMDPEAFVENNDAWPIYRDAARRWGRWANAQRVPAVDLGDCWPSEQEVYRAEQMHTTNGGPGGFKAGILWLRNYVEAKLRPTPPVPDPAEVAWRSHAWTLPEKDEDITAKAHDLFIAGWKAAKGE